MSDVAIKPATVSSNCEISSDVKTTKKAPSAALKEQAPDTFEKSKTPLGGYVVAGVTAAGAGKAAYGITKNNVGKVIASFEKEAQGLAKETGKAFKGISNNVKAYGKYGLAIAAGITTACLVFKDSDKDGKIDLLEAAGKFLCPADK